MRDFRLYVIIDRKAAKDRDLAQVASEAIAGGADIIQLRDKEASAGEIIKIGLDIRKIASKKNIPFIVNDRPDIAVAVRADGVHLGQDDLPIETARAILGKKKIIGLSTHSLGQAIEAQKRGADYIGIGPVFSTPTKPDYKSVGIDLIRQVKGRIRIPFVAIGGIDRTNIDRVIMAGAGRVAVVRAVCGAKDIRSAAHILKEKLKNI